MRKRILAICCVIATVGVACGVTADSSVQRIDQVPFELSDTIPPSTSTSTSTTTPATSTSDIATTTTIATEPVRLFFIASGQLNSVVIALSSPASLAQVLSALQQGRPVGEVGTGLRSAVPTQPEVRVSDDGSGVATIDLPLAFFNEMPTTDQRLAVAQIVLTVVVRPGIGQVRFSQDGRELAVPLGNGQLAEPGQLLTRRDYETLLDAPTDVVDPFESATTVTPGG